MTISAHIDPLIEPYWRHLERWARIWKLPDLPGQVTIEISNRLRSSIGLCYPERSMIRLHPVVRELDEPVILEVLCHEMAHVAAHRHHGRGCKPHGREWTSLVESAGYEARTRLPPGTVFATPAQRATRKVVLWRHRCPRCDASRTARRPVYTWRCATCRQNGRGGELEITREETIG
jgi:predicted SprT family Zn-dependent metalloprotease